MALAASDSLESLSEQWRRESLAYVSALNAYIKRGIETDWQGMVGSDEPKDTRQPLAERVIDAVREANATGQVEGLREKFPPAHSPFIDILQKSGQSLPVVLLLDDGQVVLRVGSPYQAGYVAVVAGNEVSQLPETVISVGRSPNRRIFAKATETGVTLHGGWEGPVVAKLGWPTGTEGVPAGFDVQRINGCPIVTRIIPFDSGDKALLISPEGVFVLEAKKAVRLLPTAEKLQEHFEWLRNEHPDDSPSYSLDMDHGALSPDGRWIACGYQSSLHYVFDARTYGIAATVGHLSEYPHHALFSADSKMVAFNSCHFYNGQSLGVPLELLPGLNTEPYKLDERLVLLEDGSRVYAGVCRDDEFIIGDASGYLRAFDSAGRMRWRHFIGSSMGDIDISHDGRTLVATTYAGFLSIIDLDSGKTDPFAIGTSEHKERRRWLFWKSESKPLIW